MAYQSFIVHVLVAFNTAMALIAGNIEPLGISQPWLTLVAIPFLVAIGTYAANQLKTIGQASPSTKTVTTSVTETPPEG